MTDQTPHDDSIVKQGGKGTDTDAGDVTRDTYGFSQEVQDGADASVDEARRALDEIVPDDELDGG